MRKCGVFLLTLAILRTFPLFADIYYPDFSSTDGLILVGSARQRDNLVEMTRAQAYQRAAIWYGEKQYVKDGFTTTFQFQIREASAVSADGIVFVIQNDNSSVIGASGGHLGYGHSDGWETTHEGEDRAIHNCIAIEFDTFENGEFGDPDADHISIHTNGMYPNSSDHVYSLGSETAALDFSDGKIHTAKIIYVPGKLSIYLDSFVEPVLAVSVMMTETLGLDSGAAWLGFTAATGGVVQHSTLLSWTGEEKERPLVLTKPYYLLESESRWWSSLAVSVFGLVS